MYFDTHAHYDFPQFDKDRDALLSEILPESGVELIVNVGSSMEGSRRSLELAESWTRIYATVGVHPSDAESVDIAELERLAAHPKCVAIGEIGLDYHYADGPARDVQFDALRSQMRLAQRLGKRVVFHNREAHEDSLAIVREFPDVCGVFHCYSGNLELAMELVGLGWYISFTGVVTFKNAGALPEVVAALPPDRIMLETDAPYLAPEPNRGKRNDSSNLRFICEAIARFRGITPESAASLTLENGKRFYGIA
ncbi:MAG: TatD family hydrolase [Oscillospiraceae bacterium]|jgi:TatD DNase family protein|nr:TatD family hydrolase [Oscillospiraceae bacterium]